MTTILTLSNLNIFQPHSYHLVSNSPWPIKTSFCLLFLALGGALTLQTFTMGNDLFYIAVASTALGMGLWLRDVIAEGTFLGKHTSAVQKGLAMGFSLFIVSETFFFLGIFWAFFHSALSPTIELGAKWPPLGIEAINPFELPLFNTVILLSSGVTVTYGHHSLIQGNRLKALQGLAYTVILAIVFTSFQGIEYTVSSFTISDGTYTSCFYFATGFHGLHVIIGTAFLLVGLLRLHVYHLTLNHHLGLEAGILYWHFVDLVWLFLYISVYYWGS